MLLADGVSVPLISIATDDSTEFEGDGVIVDVLVEVGENVVVGVEVTEFEEVNVFDLELEEVGVDIGD